MPLSTLWGSESYLSLADSLIILIFFCLIHFSPAIRRVMKQQLVVPIKMERAWLCLVNRRLRIDECIARKIQAANVLQADMELLQMSIIEKRFPPARLPPTDVAVGDVPLPPDPPALVAIGGAPTAWQQYTKLMGEIAILRDLRHEASLLAQPYDELALKNKWSSPLQRPAPTVASRPSPGPSNAGIEVEVSGTSSDSGTPSVAADATMGTGTSSDSDTSSGSEGDSGSPGPNHSRSVSD